MRNTMDMQTIYSRFAIWVGRYPDAPAVVEDGHSVSYRQLDILANAIMSRFYNERPNPCRRSARPAQER